MLHAGPLSAASRTVALASCGQCSVFFVTKAHVRCNQRFLRRLQREDRQRRGREIHRDDHREDGDPRAGRLMEQRRDRSAEHRADTLRHVEAAVVGRGVPRAEGVGERGREQREDLAPAEEHEPREQHEQRAGCRASAATASSPCLRAEGDQHRVLAAEAIRHPSEERPGRAVGDAIDRQRERQQRQAEHQDARPCRSRA